MKSDVSYRCAWSAGPPPIELSTLPGVARRLPVDRMPRARRRQPRLARRIPQLAACITVVVDECRKLARTDQPPRDRVPLQLDRMGPLFVVEDTTVGGVGSALLEVYGVDSRDAVARVVDVGTTRRWWRIATGLSGRGEGFAVDL